ncbi:MAG: hypothetical protein Q9218_008194 [Villophora microphyllina]
MGKIAGSKPPPGVYRDDPDRDDAASTSSAVLMEDVEYPESDLPAYEDVPTVVAPAQSRYHETQSYLIQPELPKSHLSRDESTTATHYPLYSQDAGFLGQMLQDQAKYPPTFTARMVGTHTETRRTKEKQEKVTVTDFDVRLDMTHLLVPNATTPPSLLQHGFETPSPGIKAYRGHRIKTASAAESAEDADAYIDSYVSSPFPVRSFTLNRRIIYHDSAALEALMTSLVGSTNYRGHLKVSFPITHRRVTVCSPCWQNDYREKTWLRWIFYLTFLWIFSWPYLWFVTRRWEVVTAVFPYSCAPDCGSRKFVTKSEHAFFQEWRASIRRAVTGKKQGWIDEEYKLATEEAGPDGFARMPSTGNATADGALGFLRQAVNVGRDVAMAGGWGADS